MAGAQQNGMEITANTLGMLLEIGFAKFSVKEALVSKQVGCRYRISQAIHQDSKASGWALMGGPGTVRESELPGCGDQPRPCCLHLFPQRTFLQPVKERHKPLYPESENYIALLFSWVRDLDGRESFLSFKNCICKNLVPKGVFMECVICS